DGNVIAVGDIEIESGNGRRHIERHAVFFGQHGHAVGADFIGDVSVGSDAVCAHHDAADAPGFKKVPGHVVGNQGGANAVSLQFPDGETGALQKRAGFIGEDVTHV